MNKRDDTIKAVKPFHPAMFAAFPVLSIYLSNVDFAGLSDLWKPLLLAVLTVSLLTIGTSFITKDWQRSAIGVTVAVSVTVIIGFFVDYDSLLGSRHHILISLPTAIVISFWAVRKSGFGKWSIVATLAASIMLFVLFDFLVRIAPWSTEMISKVAWVYLALITGLVAGQLKSGVKQLTTLLNWIGIFLVAQPTVGIIMAELSSRNDWKSPIEVRKGSTPIEDLPDIYYIVLDGYGREDVLEQYYDLPNDALADGLRERGFFVAEDSRTNYTQTMQSLATSLNMDYVQNLADLDKAETSRDLLHSLTNDNHVAAKLKEEGYRYTAIVTQSDMLQTGSADVLLEDKFGRTLLEDALISKTPFQSLDEEGKMLNPHRARVESAYRNLDNLESKKGPQFVLVHIISPHPPFVFKSDGSHAAGRTGIEDGSHFKDKGGTREEYVSGYREQSQFIASRTLASLDKILEREGVPPIVIVQSDHGPKSEMNYESLKLTEIDEVMPILNAYLVPEGMKDQLYSDISPVNSFRLIFNYLAGEEYETLPDKSYFSKWSRPYEFTEVPVE